MPVMSLRTVIVEFADAYRDFWQSQSSESPGEAVRLVESKSDQARMFTLHSSEFPKYTLTTEETDRLLSLLGQIAVTAPWRADVGRDGTVSKLTLQGAMSHMTFSWWGRMPSEWESVGAVFNFVMDVAESRRIAASE